LTLDGGIEIVTEEASKYRLGSGLVEPFPIHLPLKSGEVLLLASDGAWTPLGFPTLRKVWGRASTLHFSEFPALLLDEAGKKGCADDMTVIVMR
jgi:serine/threonine protein phosphatase PrpC